MNQERSIDEIEVLETLPGVVPTPKRSYSCIAACGAFVLLLVTLLLLFIFFGKMLNMMTGMAMVCIIAIIVMTFLDIP